ncbi:MAG: GntR family transcriptional regulator [Actinobacteria bacterium]|nr:GntR family transcriptional regulator [Actinomycetota bacterium]
MSVHLPAVGAVLPNRTSPVPLWAQVCADLRRRMALGEFVAGVPGEHALVDQYEVSRHTVREALRVLRGEGLIRSERGRASTVEPSPFSQNLGSLYSLFRTLEEHGIFQVNTVRRQSLTRNSTIAERLGVDGDADLVVVERLRFADDSPLALDTSWLLADCARPLLDVDFTHHGLYDSLSRICGVHMDSGRERIEAVRAPEHVAALLEVGRDTPMFLMERVASSEGSPLECRETFIRGDRFRLDIDWSDSRYSVAGVAHPTRIESQ